MPSSGSNSILKTNSFHSLIKIYYRTSKRFENTFIWLFIATEENPPHDFWIFFPKIIFWEEKIRILQINKSSVKTEGRRDLRQRKFSFQAGRGLRGSRRFPERAASRREKRREERGKRNPEAKLLRPFLSASQTAAKGNTLYMPTTFPKCSVQFFAATSADPDERVTHVARANTHVPLSSLSLSLSRTIILYRVFVANRSRLGCKDSRIREKNRFEGVFEIRFFEEGED